MELRQFHGVPTIMAKMAVLVYEGWVDGPVNLPLALLKKVACGRKKVACGGVDEVSLVVIIALITNAKIKD